MISVIIPHYYRNPPRELVKCTDSVAQQLEPEDEIIIVENGPGLSHPPVQLSRQIKKVYFDNRWETSYAARNCGICLARGDIIAFIDDDAWANPGWLSAIRFSFMHPAIDFLTGYVVGMAHRGKFEGEDNLPDLDLITCNAAFRKKVFQAQMFDNTKHSGEDVDFSKRLKASGFNMQVNMEARVTHRAVGFREQCWKCLRYGSGVSVGDDLLNSASGCWRHLRESVEIAIFFMFRVVGFIYYCITGKTAGKA